MVVRSARPADRSTFVPVMSFKGLRTTDLTKRPVLRAANGRGFSKLPECVERWPPPLMESWTALSWLARVEDQLTGEASPGRAPALSEEGSFES